MHRTLAKMRPMYMVRQIGHRYWLTELHRLAISGEATEPAHPRSGATAFVSALRKAVRRAK